MSEGREELLFLDAMMRYKRMLMRILEHYFELVSGKFPDKHIAPLMAVCGCMEKLGSDNKLLISDLTKELHDTPQSISRMLRMLESEGLIERHTVPIDRRKSYVSITNDGQEIINYCWLVMGEVKDRAMEKIGQERLEKLNADITGVLLELEEIYSEKFL